MSTLILIDGRPLTKFMENELIATALAFELMALMIHIVVYGSPPVVDLYGLEDKAIRLINSYQEIVFISNNCLELDVVEITPEVIHLRCHG